MSGDRPGDVVRIADDLDRRFHDVQTRMAELRELVRFALVVHSVDTTEFDGMP